MDNNQLPSDKKSFVKSVLSNVLQGRPLIRVAEKLGVSVSALSSWKNGRTVPSEANWNHCAEILGFDSRGLYRPMNHNRDDSFENVRQAAGRLDATPTEVIKLAREGVIHSFDRERQYDKRELDAVLSRSQNGFYVPAYPIDFKPDDGSRDLDNAMQRVFPDIQNDEFCS